MSQANARLVKGTLDQKENTSVNDAGHWDSRDGNNEFTLLSIAMTSTTKSLDDIAKQWGAHQEQCLTPYSEYLREYIDNLEPYNDLVDLHTLTYKKQKETESSKIKEDALQGIKQRCEIVYGVTHSEMNRFHDERKEDFNNIYKQFLQSQIDHYLKIVDILKSSLDQYEK